MLTEGEWFKKQRGCIATEAARRDVAKARCWNSTTVTVATEAARDARIIAKEGPECHRRMHMTLKSKRATREATRRADIEKRPPIGPPTQPPIQPPTQPPLVAVQRVAIHFFEMGGCL